MNDLSTAINTLQAAPPAIPALKLTKYQRRTLQAIRAGNIMLRGQYDRYFWNDSDQLCSAVARRLKSKGLIRTVYLNAVRDKVELTPAGLQAIAGGVVWSLFDGSGVMGLPWAEAGYQVYCFNADSANHGQYVIKMEHENLHYIDMWIDKDFVSNMSSRSRQDIPRPGIIFGFPDCTMFAVSGAKKERTEDELDYALEMAKAVKHAGESYGVPWMIENPVGRLCSPDMLGKPNVYFDPFEYGAFMTESDLPYHPKMPKFDGYTKKTCLWFGNEFQMPEKKPGPINIGFFWGWKWLGGKSTKTKQLRSLTPRGFARAVFFANHQRVKQYG